MKSRLFTSAQATLFFPGGAFTPVDVLKKGQVLNCFLVLVQSFTWVKGGVT